MQVNCGLYCIYFLIRCNFSSAIPFIFLLMRLEFVLSSTCRPVLEISKKLLLRIENQSPVQDPNEIQKQPDLLIL